MRFLVESHFTSVATAEILGLIPAETARGEELDAHGLRKHLFLAIDQSAVWQIFEVDSEKQLNDILVSFPLHPHMVESISQLADQ